MQARLVEIVGSVRGNAELVSSASQEIAQQGNQDPSRRTEDQTSALEQTARRAMGSTVRHNAETPARPAC